MSHDAAQPPVETTEEEIAEEEDEKLPFPNARVVRIIRESFQNEHILKREVKVAMNNLAGEIVSDIARKMDALPYTTLSIDHFNLASRKYREIDLTEKQIHTIKKMLEKERAELDEIIAKIELDHPGTAPQNAPQTT